MEKCFSLLRHLHKLSSYEDHVCETLLVLPFPNGRSGRKPLFSRLSSKISDNSDHSCNALKMECLHEPETELGSKSLFGRQNENSKVI